MRDSLFLTACLWTTITCAQTPRPAPGPPPATNALIQPRSAIGTPHATWPGKQPDGSLLLPNQWSLRPVGRQVEVGDFPVNIALHPKGGFAAVLHAGYGKHEIIVVSIPGGRITARTNLAEVFYGIEFSAGGRQLFASGAGDEVVHAFGFEQGQLSGGNTIRLRPAKERGVPAGLALDSRAEKLFAAELWGHRVTRIDLTPQPKVTEILLDPAGAPSSVAPVAPSLAGC